MPIVSVPYCYLPNSKVQVFNTETSQRSPFQIARVKEISEKEDFAYFVILLDKGQQWVLPDDEECGKGPYHLTYYTRDGSYCCEKIGQKRVLQARNYGKSFIAPLDGVVYSSRCN